MIERIRAMPRWQKLVAAAVACLLAYTVVGFVILPPIVKSVLQKKLSESLNRQTMIEDIDLNPYALSCLIEGFVTNARESTETFLSFDQLYLNLEAISLLKWAIITKEIRIERPYVNLIRHEETRYNFSDLIQESKESTPAAEPSKPVRFSLNNIQILNGVVDIWDKPKDKRHRMADMTVQIPTISNQPHRVDIFVEPLFQARFNETAVSLKGKTKPFHDTLETVFDIDLRDINVPHYLAYVPMEQRFKVLSGLLDVKGTLSYIQQKDAPPTFSVTGDVTLKTTEVVDANNQPVLKLPRLYVAIAPTELFSRKVHLSRISVELPEVNVVRDEAGNTNIQSMLPEKETGDTTAESREESFRLSVNVDEIRLATGKVLFSDVSGSQPFETTLEPIDVSISHFSTDKDKKGGFNVSLQTEANEKVTLAGEFSLDPMAVESNLALQGVGLKKYAPYFADQVKIDVIDGSFSTTGKLSLGTSKDGQVTAKYKGAAGLSGLATVDKLHADDLVKWKSLSLNKINFGYNPTYVNIEEIALDDFYTRLIVNPDGKLNLQAIVAEKGDEEGPLREKEKEVAPSKEDEQPLMSIKLDRVTLSKGHVNFTDKSIDPTYATDLVDIQGRISGLSSQETEMADVHLSGKLDDYAPLDITGKINPLIEDLHADLKIAFKNIDLSPMTPYAGKYVGYTIQKGKLSLDLTYLIDKRKLDSENKAFLDQFTFGDKVDSPEATNLPVKLGVSLLKNRAGEIDLDLPVSGDLDDPEFRVGKVILKMIMNLLVKAATSPFGLLGAAFGGGGEELSALEFDYGRFEITAESQQKLDTLVQALYDRPALSLDIEGHVDLEQDKEGLRQYFFDKQLKAQKHKDVAKKDSPSISVDEITIGPEEYEEYLWKAYKAADFKKQKNVIGRTKKLPVPEMEQLLLEHINVEEGDLRLLAIQRAQRVKDYILQSDKVETERIFLIEPQSLAPEKKEALKDSRVDLRLK